MGLFDNKNKRMVKNAIKEAQANARTPELVTVKCPRCGYVLQTRFSSYSAMRPCKCGYNLSLSNQVSTGSGYTSSNSSTYAQPNNAYDKEAVRAAGKAVGSLIGAFGEWLSNSGTEEIDPTDPDIIRARKLQGELISIRTKIIANKQKIGDLAEKKLSIYNEKNRCLNCENDGLRDGEVCDKCGAINGSGEGQTGIPFRSYKTANISFQLFQDGFIDILEKKSHEYHYRTKLDHKKIYYEFISNHSYEALSEIIILPEDGRLIISPIETLAPYVVMDKENSVCIFRENEDHKTDGLEERILPSGKIKRKVYHNGELSEEETAESYFNYLEKVIKKIKSLLE